MKKPTSTIYTSEPVLDGNEKKYILDCLQRNWITFDGHYTHAFEKKFAKFIGTEYALLCGHGTDALRLALAACDVGQGDEVIVPDLTIIASASTVIDQGAVPVLVDVDRYWCLDPAKIEEKITKRTKAIMVVHMYGIPANMPAIMRIARKYKLYVIEDACAAHGSQVGDKKVGSIGDAGCFSFYTSKTIVMGEGGAVTTNNTKLAQKVRLLRNQAFENPRFTHEKLGFNSRITDIQAAIGLAQLEKINDKLKRRQEIDGFYTSLLKDIPEVSLPQEPPWGRRILWMYPILIQPSFGRSRDEVLNLLAKKGIYTERFFLAMSKQPVFRNKKSPNFPDIKGNFKNAQLAGETGLYLPGGLSLSPREQKFIVSTLLSLRK